MSTPTPPRGSQIAAAKAAFGALPEQRQEDLNARFDAAQLAARETLRAPGTAARALSAAFLAKHWTELVVYAEADGTFDDALKCRCGREFNNPDEWADHVLSAVGEA